MNPITLPIAELKPALTGLGKIINRHAKLPVLTHIKIERTKDGSSPFVVFPSWRFCAALNFTGDSPPLPAHSLVKLLNLTLFL